MLSRNQSSNKGRRQKADCKRILERTLVELFFSGSFAHNNMPTTQQGFCISKRRISICGDLFGPHQSSRCRLLDGVKVGDYQELAKVAVGGDIGETKSYVLPAIVIGDRTIEIALNSYAMATSGPG
eukprot:scaffold158509_cov66-Attheya_sp.AAC.1